MDVPLLKTKRYIPAQHSPQVSHSRLMRRFIDGVRRDRALTLVSAPVGFGKTAMMSACAAASRWTVGWLSLDGDDNDPAHF